MEFFVSTLLFGISVGGQYALIAIGYTMVYGILRLINFAHGDVFMVAGLLGIYLSSFLSAYLPPAAVISVTVVIGSALAAVGSMLYFTTYPAIVPTAGAMPGLKAFVAAVFGGIGSIPGAVIGAFLIGICENFVKIMPFDGATTFVDAFTFALLIIILVFKPTGLFGEKATDKV